MTPERWARLKTLFAQAVDLQSIAQARFVQQVSAHDSDLASSLRSLLQHNDTAPALLEGPLLSKQRIVEYLSAGVRTFQNDEIVAGRFCILRFIGEGGMGEVYAARDLDLGEEVALKTLRPCLSSNDQLLERFKLEIQTARKVTHPNVCRVFDLFWHQVEVPSQKPIAFLTMELIRGETLEQRIRRLGRLSEVDALPILRQLVFGLSAAHNAGIIHRDFKSGNILLLEQPGALRALITDFGLARSINQDSTLCEGGIEGTPAYVAPEQLDGSSLTPATDIYALGVVLFEMLTGSLPFPAVDSWDAVAQQRKVPPSVRDKVPFVHRRWEAAITACLQYEPANRPSHAEQLLDRLTDRRISRRQLAIATAGTVATAVSAALYLRPTHLVPEAARSFKRGEDFAQRRNADGLKNAIEEFNRVVKLEPNYAPAWIGLADAYSALGNFDLLDPREALAKSKFAAGRAAALDRRSGRAQGILGRILSLDVHEWRTAEPYLRKAVSLEPANPMIRLWYGAYLGKLGRSQDAFEQLAAGIEQAPSSMPLNQQIAIELFWTHNFSEFLTQARDLLRLQPFEAGSHLVLARALEWEKRFTEALRSCDEADKLQTSEVALCYRAAIEIARGDKTRGSSLAAQIRLYWSKQPFESTLLAALYAQLNDPATAVAILNSGFDRDDSTVLTAACNPYFETIQTFPGFRSFLNRIGCP